ncbi:MAG TPA: insulinase family protein [Sphingomicrobium sp.]|nr:insulinase family protein [Sphingomicrobium sp.]
MKYRVLAATCLSLVATPLLAQQPLMEQPGRWAQDYTRRKADPSVRFGTLPNGMRYAIMHNETPKDGVSMRMRIGSGSLEERDDEQGLAHFLEHMAFRGSKNVADGEVVHMLERQGLSFGADTNAGTLEDETIYMFNFPRADAAALDTGLTLFREIGGRLNLAQSAIDEEKGVVLSEERLRDTPGYRTVKAEFNTLFDGTRAIERWPIGKVDVIKSADHAKLERFYQANYRPDNATIVIVGNIDPAAVEKQIIARFSDWKAAAAPDAIDFGAPTGRDKTGEIVAEGVPDAVSVNWVGPADRRAETLTLDREFLLKNVALAVLNQRLADRALQPGAPFVRAQADHQRSVFHSGAITSISVSAPADKWQAALDAASAEQRMLLRDGVQPAELKRAIERVRTALRTQAATASTRQSSALADAIVNSVNEDELYTSPAQDLALYEPMLAKITPAEVNAAMKSLFAEQGPILFRSAQKDPATDAQLAQALTGAYSGKLGAEVKQAAITWPYTSFGKPSAIVSRTADPKIGTTTVKFANGTRLLVKPTNYEKDQIDVAVSFADGRAGVQPALAHGLWETQLFTLGGTKKLSLADITRWTQERGKVESVALGAGDRSFSLAGKTRPADLLSQMQLLDAYARDPGFRPEAYEKAKAVAPTVANQIAGDAGATYSRGAQALLVGNDPRFFQIQFPSDSALANVGPQDLPGLLKQPLASQADVVIVGDVTVDQAIRATEATFAAGATTKPLPDPEPQVTMTQPRAAPYVFEHGGRADQAFYGEYFQLPDYFADPKTSDVGDVAAAILSARLVDTVREKLGITYSPNVQSASSLDLKGEGYFGVTLETPPSNFDKFHALLADQIRDMASKPVSADELERAKQPLIEAQKKKLETNAYWLGKLTQMTRDPRIEGQLLSEEDNLSAVSAADVQAMVAKFIAGHQPLTIIARAKPQ